MSVPNPEAASPDAELEARIDTLAIRLHTAETPGERRVAWSELRRLHALRSSERVQEMEEEKGLAR